VQPRCWLNNPKLWTLPAPTPESHKYSRGDLSIIGGASMTGAARLAAAAARRGGAGMVTIAALGSAVLGVAVFFLWIGPDLLFHYRHHWLFSNPLTGEPVSSIPPELRRTPWFLALRTASCALLVPVVEEPFWRGWLMRWLIHKEFLEVPIGAYAPFAFWIVALLFASEHGPYWEVGLITGILYNWWAIRTKTLADCILAHAVTNACLSAYVLATAQWQYWL